MTKSWSQMSSRAGKIRRRMARLAMPVTALVAVSVLAVACASAKQPGAQPSIPAPTQSTSTSTAPPAQTTPPAPRVPSIQSVPACATSDLKVSLQPDQGGGAMGSFYYLIEFKNVSGHVCQLRGFPGVSAYAAGHQVGSSASWATPAAEPSVRLQPGASAHSLMRMTNVGVYPPKTCGQVNATSLRVYPPNQSVAVNVPYRFGACSVTGVRFLNAWPVQAGTSTRDGQTVLSSKVMLGWQWPNASSPYGVQHSYSVPPLPVLRQVSVGQHETYDRISFTFTGTFPSYDLSFVPSLVADPSGKSVRIEGDAVLRIHFTQAAAHNSSGRSRVTVTPVHVGYQAIAGYALAGDFEGVVTYGVGTFGAANAQPRVRVIEVDKTDGLGGHLHVVATDIQTRGLGNRSASSSEWR